MQTSIWRRWWIYPLGLLLLIILLFTVLETGGSDSNTTASDFVGDVDAGRVSEVIVASDNESFRYKLRNGGEFKVEKEEELSVQSILREGGVSEEDISGLDISKASGGPIRTVLRIIFTFFPLLIFVGLLAFFLTRSGRKSSSVDPVCGIRVKANQSAGASVFQDVTYYFCSPEHKTDFDADPVKYLLKA